MIWEYANKIFKIKKIWWWYEVYVADYQYPSRVWKFKKCTKRSSLCWVIKYIIDKSWESLDVYCEKEILMWYVCAESREKYLMDVYNKD